MSLLDVNISIINKFCENFKDNFSNTQFSAFAMLPYAMLKDYKRLNLCSLAKELIEETVTAGIPFSHIVFDSWYASCDMIDFIDDLGKRFVSEVKSDRRLFIDLKNG